ncbi:MAG: ATP-binding protein [Acidimicrobiales bacterium]
MAAVAGPPLRGVPGARAPLRWACCRPCSGRGPEPRGRRPVRPRPPPPRAGPGAPGGGGRRPGTGKSTTALALADELGAALLRTDEIRRRDDGRGYQPAEVRRTYEEVLAEARRLLALGEHVVLDATFRSADERDSGPPGRRRCHGRPDRAAVRARPHEAARRVARRIEAGGDPSEATPAVALALAAEFDPWPEAVELDAALAPDEVLAAARRAVEGEARPDGHGVAAAIGDRTEELASSGVRA